MSGEPLRILIVEDSEADATMILRLLSRELGEVRAERVEESDALRSALGRSAWDIVLSDWTMPRFSASAALEVVKKMGVDVPFVIVSGTVGEETAVEAMRAGAQDFVLKDRLSRLIPVVQRAVLERREREAHRRADAALHVSNMRFKRLVESGIVGIVIADPTGRVIDANDSYLAMVGYTREELVNGKIRWSDMTPPSRRPRTEIAREQMRTRGVAEPWEKEYVRKDGTRVPVLVGVAALDEKSNISFVVDMTELKVAKDSLRETEAQLRQAQKMEAIGLLAGGIAHDFNNLLSVILSLSWMCASELGPTHPMRADLDQIRLAGERAAELTRQLLAFSRQQVMQPRRVDLSLVVGGTEKMLRRLIGEDVDLKFVLASDLGKVLVDPGQVEQVVMNLVVNARDAMPNGGKLTIETGNVLLDGDYACEHIGTSPGPHVMLAVSDNGSGMDAATQARIFDPFFTTKDVGKGTGLGLSTVFGIVKQSGGSIWVYSEVGMGTTFKIYLPHRHDEPADKAPAPEPPPVSRNGSETILLVEDDEDVRELVRTILTRQGYQVLDARTGEEALGVLERHPGAVHLMVTDVVMPKMSGREVAERVQALRPSVRVLYMSGYTDHSVIHHGVLEAGVAFLQKPITPANLMQKIREVLDRASYLPPRANS